MRLLVEQKTTPPSVAVDKEWRVQRDKLPDREQRRLGEFNILPDERETFAGAFLLEERLRKTVHTVSVAELEKDIDKHGASFAFLRYLSWRITFEPGKPFATNCEAIIAHSGERAPQDVLEFLMERLLTPDMLEELREKGIRYTRTDLLQAVNPIVDTEWAYHTHGIGSGNEPKEVPAAEPAPAATEDKPQQHEDDDDSSFFQFGGHTKPVQEVGAPAEQQSAAAPAPMGGVLSGVDAEDTGAPANDANAPPPPPPAPKAKEKASAGKKKASKPAAAAPAKTGAGAVQKKQKQSKLKVTTTTTTAAADGKKKNKPAATAAAGGGKTAVSAEDLAKQAVKSLKSVAEYVKEQASSLPAVDSVLAETHLHVFANLSRAFREWFSKPQHAGRGRVHVPVPITRTHVKPLVDLQKQMPLEAFTQQVMRPLLDKMRQSLVEETPELRDMAELIDMDLDHINPPAGKSARPNIVLVFDKKYSNRVPKQRVQHQPPGAKRKHKDSAAGSPAGDKTTTKKKKRRISFADDGNEAAAGEAEQTANSATGDRIDDDDDDEVVVQEDKMEHDVDLEEEDDEEEDDDEEDDDDEEEEEEDDEDDEQEEEEDDDDDDDDDDEDDEDEEDLSATKKKKKTKQ